MLDSMLRMAVSVITDWASKTLRKVMLLMLAVVVMLTG